MENRAGDSCSKAIFHFRFFHSVHFSIYSFPVYHSLMKAAVIVTHGGVEGLEIREVATPASPTADRVRVRVRAAGLNRADILQRMGRYPAPPGAPKTFPGSSSPAKSIRLDRKCARGSRASASLASLPAERKPNMLSFPKARWRKFRTVLDWAAAAAVPEVFITAHDALFTQADLRMGESVLVHAAGSGVGTAAMQLARAAGAKVFGTSRTAEKLERAKPYGLDESIAVDDDPRRFVAAVHDWTRGKGVDVILDLVGAAYLEANLTALAARGRMMLVGTTSGAKATLDFSAVMSKRLRITGTVLRARSTEEKATATRLFARHVVPLLADGVVQPVIDRIYKLAEIREAHTRLESNETFGKVVLVID